jgi:MFS family permease
MPSRRDIPLLAGATAVSAAGDMALWVLLAVHVAGVAGTPAAVSALFICLWGPVAALAGPAGRIVDGHETRRVLILASVAQAVAAAGMAVAADSLLTLFALCAVLGAGAAVSAPAEFALVPAAAGGRRLAAANGHMELARAAGMTAGPILGGALAAAGLTRLGLLLNAASFLVVALAALGLHARRHPAAAGDAAPDARSGVAILRGDRTLRLTLATAVGSLLFFSITISADVFFATEVLGAGPGGYGLLTASWTAGMVAGAAGVARLVPARWTAVAALAGIAIQGAGLLGAAVGASMALALLAFVTGGTAHGVKNVALRTLIHERVEDAVRGRAFAAYNAARNGAELAALAAGGVVVALAGPRLALGLAGTIPLLLALAALTALTPGVRRARAAAA